MRTSEEIKAFHARSEASVKEYLRSKSWPEKVRSIQRMNEFSRKARAAMREAQAKTNNPAEDSDQLAER